MADFKHKYRIARELLEQALNRALLVRATAHVRTLHPEFRGATRIWRRGESIEIRTTRHGIELTSDYQNSPIQHIERENLPEEAAELVCTAQEALPRSADLVEKNASDRHDA